MKKRRIFISINLPEHIKKRILKWQGEWASLPVRWTKKQSLHITLAFIGYATDEEMLEVCQIVRQISAKHQPFEIELKRVCLGPSDNAPRMFWLEGERNLALARLKDDLENQLLDSGQSGLASLKPWRSGYNRKEVRAFHPHITLARIRQREWRLMPSKPKIEKEVSLSFPVESIEVMESRLLRDGAEYVVLESVLLG